MHHPLLGEWGRLCLRYRSLELGIGVSDQGVEGFPPTRVDLAAGVASQLDILGCLRIHQRLDVG